MSSVPPVVWFMRRNMRSHRGQLSLPQFRALARVKREPSVSITEISEHLGTALSTTSRLVSGLVSRGLLARDASRVDRRQMSVTITAKGASVLNLARAATRKQLEIVFEPLSKGDRGVLKDAMTILRRLFSETNGLPKNANASTLPAPSPTPRTRMPATRMSPTRNNRLNR